MAYAGACGSNNTNVNTRPGWYSRGVTDATTGEGFEEADALRPPRTRRSGRCPYIERGEVVPMLTRSFPLTELRAAQQTFIDKQHTGDIVVIP